MLKTQLIDYQDDNTILEGYYAANNTSEKKPVVLIVHDWTGKNEFARTKAEKIAALGYIGFAIDMYGKGIIGNTKEEKSALIQPLMENRQLLQKRILAALDTARNLENADNTRIAVMGFCFGGLCALDLARSGADIKGAISFHGLFYPSNLPVKPIKAKVLAMHGYEDPMATPEQALAFMQEMTTAKANWELDMYSNTLHAFTNPQANDHAFGTVYDNQADERSWTRMTTFLKEIFS